MTCPDDYAFNCKNYEVKCRSCKAVNLEGERLFYSPIMIGAGVDQHPYLKEAKTERSKVKAIEKQDRNTDVAKRARYYNRKGKEIERKVIKGIQGARLTFNSGATNSDCDAVFKTEHLELRVEHKTRFTNRNVLGPTSPEWKKGLTQGADLFLITHKDETVVTMRLETLETILELVRDLEGRQSN